MPLPIVCGLGDDPGRCWRRPSLSKKSASAPAAPTSCPKTDCAISAWAGESEEALLLGPIGVDPGNLDGQGAPARVSSAAVHLGAEDPGNLDGQGAPARVSSAAVHLGAEEASGRLRDVEVVPFRLRGHLRDVEVVPFRLRGPSHPVVCPHSQCLAIPARPEKHPSRWLGDCDAA